MENAIEIDGLTKRYPLVKRYRDMLLHPLAQEKITSLRDVSFSVHKGELFGILGPNGAGKTTLLKIMAGLILPDHGHVSFNGSTACGRPALMSGSIGFVVNEERSFYWRLTGRQNLEFFAVLNDIEKSVLRERVSELLELVGLEKDAGRMFKDYSTGMKQRLAIARSLLTDPDILLMDEPTRSLDPTGARNLRHFIKGELADNKNKTVCMATHNLFEAEQICSRLAILHKGRLLACGSPGEIKNLLPAEDILEVHLTDTPEDTGVALNSFCKEHGYRIRGFTDRRSESVVEIEVKNIRAGISLLVSQLAGAGFAVKACTPKEPSLEDAFDRILEQRP